MDVRKPDAGVSDAVRKQADDWLIRLHSGQATREDLQSFRRWYAQDPRHARVFDELKQLWSLLEPATRNGREEINVDAVLEHSAWQARYSRRAFLGGAVAAPVVAWFTLHPPMQLWPGVGEFMADYRTGTGEQKQVVMEDGTVVEMNTQTRIDRRVDASGRNAIELLAGEAEVSTPSLAVSAAAPFVLYAGKGRLQAQAARYNVRYTGDSVCVSCLQGAVEVSHGSRRIALAPAQQTTYDAVSVREPIAAGSLEQISAWRQQQLIFADTPLAEAIEEINRYRPGKLVLRDPALRHRRVKMRLSFAQLDNAGELIGELYGTRVRHLIGGIVLLG